MVNQLILDRVAIWRPKPKDNFAVRQSPAGRVHFERGIAKTTKNPTFRYAKNYSIGKGKNAVKFCLMLMTESVSEKSIEKFLDDTSKKIDIAFAQRVVMNSTDVSFEYTDFNYEGDK